MTALEIRLLGYGLLLILIVGGSAFMGYRLSSRHYQALMTADKAAEQQAVLAQQEKVIAARMAQEAASVAAEKQVEDAKASSALIGDELARSLRSYAYLRSSLMSAASKPTADSHASAEGAAGNPGLTGLAGQAATACEEDAATLSALQSWARAISQTQR